MPKGKNRGVHVKYRPERNCWEVVEYISGKLKRHATGYGRREDAEEKLAEIIVERSTPQVNEGEVTLGQLIAWYIKEHVRTLARPENALKCFERLIPFWGNLKLIDLKKKSNVFEYIKHREREFQIWQEEGGYTKRRKLKPQTVRRELEQLQAVIGLAYHENLISINPYIWKPDKSKSRDRWLTHKEAAQIIKAATALPRANDYLRLFIIIGLYTGARSDAISKLRWPQVDFNAGFINFTPAQRSDNKRAVIVPMPRRLKRELLKARKEGLEMGYVVNLDQQRIKSVKNSFASACEDAGLEGVTPHTLRHTAVSWMVQKGVPFAKVGKYVGMSVQMVEHVYGHMAPGHLQEATESYG